MGKAGKAKTILLVFSFIRPGSGRFGVGFWVGLRAWDFPTERVLSRAPLIIRTVDQKTIRGPTPTQAHKPSNAMRTHTGGAQKD